MARNFNYIPESQRYSGREFEHDAFGSIKKTREYLRDLKGIVKPNDYRDIPYAKEDDAVWLAKKHQPKIEKQIAKDLRLTVAELLDLDDDEVRLYSSVGTPFDRYFGSDAFIEIKDKVTGKIYRVTLDATLNRQKIQHKADMMLYEVDVPRTKDSKEEVLKYLSHIEDVAKEVINIYKRKVRRGDVIDQVA